MALMLLNKKPLAAWRPQYYSRLALLWANSWLQFLSLWTLCNRLNFVPQCWNGRRVEGLKMASGVKMKIFHVFSFHFFYFFYYCLFIFNSYVIISLLIKINKAVSFLLRICHVFISLSLVRSNPQEYWYCFDSFPLVLNVILFL